MSYKGLERIEGGLERDSFGCIWRRGAMDLLVTPPLESASLLGYSLPNLPEYYAGYADEHIQKEFTTSNASFRVGIHSFGLFERAWSLRGFEPLLMDFYDNPSFCRELIEYIASWILQSVDAMLKYPFDAILLTDDYAEQRGMIFSLDIFRSLFKPWWEKIFKRIHDAGVYTVLHVCGNAEPALEDLIECGLDCLESLQPEAMDVYRLKREYGDRLRMWGGLGVQSTITFGKPDEVIKEVARLKSNIGKGGGYILSTAKEMDETVPVENVIAYFEEAQKLLE
jgi:uroporphyrinogen decarboxylase